MIPLSVPSQVGVPGTAVVRDGTPGRPIRVGWWFDALLVAGLAGLTAARWCGGRRYCAWTLVVRDWCDAHRPPPVHITGLVLDHLGQGGTTDDDHAGRGLCAGLTATQRPPILPAGVAVTRLLGLLPRPANVGGPGSDDQATWR